MFSFWSKKEPIYKCCGNCENFVKSFSDLRWGFCPAIYWPYDVYKILTQSFCKEFQLAKRFRNKYRVDKKSRNSKDCLIKRLETAGFQRGPGMISDSYFK